MLQTIITIEKGFFDWDANSTILFVFLKLNKDPSLRSSFRPLSILNTLIKIHAKVLALRLESHMTKLVHHNQTGFMKQVKTVYLGCFMYLISPRIWLIPYTLCNSLIRC